ncbi:MAG: hypothetical protein JWN36_311 [Microbacteriaceae bacterium]|nr:hypothetical protein [Microbacteriaceae bacterium]
MTETAPQPSALFAVQRTVVVILAIVAIVIGVIALVWSGATLDTIGFLFGVFLVVSGVLRIVRAIAGRREMGGWFWLNLVAGVLVLVAGVLSLTDPAKSLTFLAIIIGLGWLLSGVVDLAVAVNAGKRPGRWLVILGGLLALVAGAALLFIPVVTITVFLKIGAVLLIVVGIGALLTYPRRRPVK